MEIGTILDLLEERGKAKLVTVNHNEIVENAIGIMLKKDYSQLPVIKGDKAVGVISYESLAKTVFNFTESKQNHLQSLELNFSWKEFQKYSALKTM